MGKLETTEKLPLPPPGDNEVGFLLSDQLASLVVNLQTTTESCLVPAGTWPLSEVSVGRNKC